MRFRGFDMNIGGPLTQGLLEDLIDPFGDVFRACILRQQRLLSGLAGAYPSALAPAFNIDPFCVAKRSASISSVGGVSTTAMDIVCSSLCSSRA